MKTTKKTTSKVPKKEPTKKNSAAVRAAQGRELGLKEQVKAGLLTAKQAMTTLAKKGDGYGIKSNTYQWLKNREAREGTSKASAKTEASA